MDVVTVEFENVPAAALERLGRRRPVRPGARSLRIAQNRVAEKDFFGSLGLETTPCAALDDAAGAAAVDRRIGRPAILKTQTLGYDGKGQVLLDEGDDLLDAWQGTLGGRPAILEAQFAAIEREVSLIVARTADGTVASFDPVENRHAKGILDVTLAPAAIPPALAAAAREGAERTVRALDHVGVLCVEFFVTAGGRLLANEIAPRVHNSGHWTIEGCATSQFAQHVRAVCGLPLGSPARRANAAMKNLIGRGRRALAGADRRPGRARSSLRQGGDQGGPQDGPRHLALAPRRAAAPGARLAAGALARAAPRRKTRPSYTIEGKAPPPHPGPLLPREERENGRRRLRSPSSWEEGDRGRWERSDLSGANLHLAPRP